MCGYISFLSFHPSNAIFVGKKHMGMLPRVPGNKDKELVKQTYPMHMGRERHVVGIIWEKSYVMP